MIQPIHVPWSPSLYDRYERRLRLRPHGRGGRVWSLWSYPTKESRIKWWTADGENYLASRAQAAQAVYEGGRSAE